MPSPLSVTALRLPVPVRLSVTVPPLELRSFPTASRSCTVIVLVALPLAMSVVGAARIVVVSVEGVPAVIV